MLGKVFVGANVSNLDTGSQQALISRVVLKVDSETTYTAGDDSGTTVEKECPWGSQAMCDAILARMRGAVLPPFVADEGLLDPAAEVGDGITVGGVYSQLVETTITFDALCAADVSAPGEDEVDEYPYKSRARRTYDRQISQTRSRITKTAEEIRLEVENTAAGLRTEFTVGLSGIAARVSDAEGNIGALQLQATQFSVSIQDANRNISSLKQFADSLTLSVSNGADSSTLKLMAGRTELASKEIYFTGMVTFNDLSGNKTIINGSTIDTSTLYLDSLYGSNIYIRRPNGDIAAEFRTWDAATARSKLQVWTRALDLESYGGDVYIKSILGYVTLDAASGVTCGNDFYPSSNNRYSCGISGFRWADVYSVGGVITGSDWNEKTDINYDLSRYDALFDALRPCSFRRKDGTSGRTHTGLIAQDVEAALDACGMTGTDLAAWCRWETEEGAGCGLRYEELIALLIHRVRRLEKTIIQMGGILE